MPAPQSTARRLLLCFSHLRWNFVFQRPQHLLVRAATTFDVKFLEEPEFADAAVAEIVRIPISEGLTRIVPRIPAHWSETAVTQFLRTVVEDILANEVKKPLLWYYTPLALRFSDHVEAQLVIYDNMDELSAFEGAAPEMRFMESRLITKADLVFCGGKSLFQAKRGRHPNVHLFPSSVDTKHFNLARYNVTDPPDQMPITYPRVGFFGVIDERMNTDLLANLARLRPHYQFVMLGPTAKIDPATLPRSENIHWLGLKSYGELPRYLAGWDVGIMPFALNASTRFISPTKTPEFLAAGLPVVSSPIPDVISGYGHDGLVEIANSDFEFSQAIDRLLARPKGSWIKRVDARLALQSWDSTWAEMLNHIAGFTKGSRMEDAQALRETANV